ncbi:3349_t:CDS:2 [Acaulospora morrowiae]|uniref:3349_t:CDS:1 n=1 Tax=Acaulospora morrowiae TaxID=94023 RepID=A0A9N8ZFI9_9GLOM|nr:3349_t:CDS:2 [Acaulospora morrowiae]
MSFPNTDLTIQFACVFVVFLLWIVSLIPVRRAQTLQFEGYNNSNPREQYNNLSAWGRRAVSASNNTIEALVFFSAAVFTRAFSQISQYGGTSPTGKDGTVATATSVFCIIYAVIRADYCINSI